METNQPAEVKKLSARDKIEYALVELLKEKAITDITVADVTEKSQVSKSTFYRNYHDIFEVYECMVSALMQKSVGLLKGLFIQRDISTDLVEKTIREDVFAPDAFHFSENDTFVMLNAMESGNIKVLRIFYKKLYDAFYDAYEKKTSDKDGMQFYCAFFIRAFISCFLADFTNGKSFNMELIYLALEMLNPLKDGKGASAMQTSSDSKTIEKTKRRLRNALTSLLISEKREKVSVKELTQEADVSRATFYLHYKNIEDFYTDTVNYIFALFGEQVLKFMKGGIENAKQNSKKYNLLMKEDDRKLFGILLKEYFDVERYNKGFRHVYNGILCYAVDKHGQEFLEVNYTKIRFFASGYIFAMAESLADYNADRLYRDIVRSFSLWGNIIDQNKTTSN